MTGNKGAPWTPELEQQFVELNSQGLSCSKIAAIMGKTRSAVAGKRRRLNSPAVRQDKENLWTPELEQQLADLNNQGLTCSRIAEIMGKTRSAIAGKRSRLGLPVVGEDADQRRKRVAPAVAGNVMRGRGGEFIPKLVPRPAVQKPVAPQLGGVFFDDMEPHHCRYPLGEIMDPLLEICGAPRTGHGPYCAKHHAKAYRPEPNPG